MGNDLKWVVIYLLTIAVTVFTICVCLEFYYMKEDLKLIRQHSALALEIRIHNLEEILK